MKPSRTWIENVFYFNSLEFLEIDQINYKYEQSLEVNKKNIWL